MKKTKKLTQKKVVRIVSKKAVRKAAPQPKPVKALQLPAPSEVKALDSEALSLSHKISSLAVDTPEQENKAVNFGVNLAGLKKKISTFWANIIGPVNDLHKNLCEQRNAHLAPVDDALGTLKRKLDTYYTERDRVAAAEAEAINEKRSSRSMAEAKSEAMDLIKKGKLDEAAQLLRDAKSQFSEVIPESTVTSAGAQRREPREIEVFDEKLVPDKYWLLDMAALRRDALGNKAQGIEPIKIPGVRIVKGHGVALRAAVEA